MGVPEALIRAAAQLFAERGYDATSVSAIVQTAHLTKGAMYYYFSAKEDLLFAIQQRFIEAEMRQAQHIVSVTASPEERLTRLIVALVESVAKFPQEVTVFFREMHRLSGKPFEAVRETRDAYQQIFEDTIVWGQQEAAFRRDLEPRILTLALFGECNWTYTWMRPDGRLAPTQIGQRLAQIFMTGLITV